MEFELITDGVADDYAFGAEDIDVQEYPPFEGDEGERCGICMDVVVDRGVLDCCQHWFCFACIDNWASITNLCPLCQNEFQLITCVPVYDTVGNSQPDEDSYTRDEDWCIEGKNNTLSFPSYYIDENAVSCLEGESCKIRNRSSNLEEDPNLDTSIACDSCDLWYHAICVGFDPDGSCENSWLCPRCLVEETPRIPVGAVPGPSNTNGPETTSHECLMDATFPRKVSVSVADDGETAVVVSIIDGSQRTEESSEKVLSSLNVGEDLIIGNQGNEERRQPSSNAFKGVNINAISGDRIGDMGKEMGERVSKKPKIEAVELDLPLSQGTASTLASKKSPEPGLRRNFVDKATGEPDVSDGLRASENPYDERYSNKSVVHLGLGSSVGSLLSAHDTDDHPSECAATGEVKKKNILRECRLSADRRTDKKKIAVGAAGAKRKQRDYRSAEDEETKSRMRNGSAAKRVKPKRSPQTTHSKDQADDSISDDSQNKTGSMAGAEGGIQTGTIDIKDIVQGTYRKPSNRLFSSNVADKSSKDGEHANRVRVKKIMRRATEDKESSVVVQNLRKEIRDAIRNRSSNELGDNVFDPKLLAAFRTALAGQTTETRKPKLVDLKAKKALLQKGTTRENLTKKIYGIGGKRKRAWTRDCEIEFWKHRCLKVSKPEKIETLKSVLDHLRKGPDVTEIKKENDPEAPSSILTRLYVADASVFPRKDDIKPLSAIKATLSPDQARESTSTEKALMPATGDSCAESPQMSEVSVRSANSSGNSKGGNVINTSIKAGATSSKVNLNKGSKQSSKTSSSSLTNSQKEKDGRSDISKIDKRKWALEVLARKAAASGKNATQGKEDHAVIKGNYPLLAQLEADMRPVLAPSRHNKIPISIRQAQLYRLTEHFLRKTNVPVTRRTAEIELAVADAVNIEKAVADRSSSKLVYVNLCSQELLRRSDNVDSATTPDSTVHVENSETATNDLSTSSEVDEALKNAGLSDSPPNSPSHQTEETKEEGPENVFELDSQPDLDIYGDFEYDLEDDDFIGANALKVAKLQQDESKIKVVFSTLDSERSDSGFRFEDCEVPPVAENAYENGTTEQYLAQNPPLEEAEGEENANKNGTAEQCVGQNPPLEEAEGEEILGECEELYGPDKEPLFSKCPEIKPLDFVPDNIVAEANGEQGSNLATNVAEPCSGTSENLVVPTNSDSLSVGKDVANRRQETAKTKEQKSHAEINKQSDKYNPVFKKVEAYIKEHIRPLCKSGVITVEQYRWAVGKTTDKIMKYHSKDTNANFLIKEGEKVKKLAEEYVEAAQKVEHVK